MQSNAYLTKEDWLKIGFSAGWLRTGKRYRRVCAWCDKILGENVDEIEPVDEYGFDTHGFCPSCAREFYNDINAHRAKKGLPPVQSPY